jgi:hypothetical protein
MPDEQRSRGTARRARRLEHRGPAHDHGEPPRRRLDHRERRRGREGDRRGAAHRCGARDEGQDLAAARLARPGGWFRRFRGSVVPGLRRTAACGAQRVIVRAAIPRRRRGPRGAEDDQREHEDGDPAHLGASVRGGWRGGNGLAVRRCAASGDKPKTTSAPVIFACAASSGTRKHLIDYPNEARPRVVPDHGGVAHAARPDLPFCGAAYSSRMFVAGCVVQ